MAVRDVVGVFIGVAIGLMISSLMPSIGLIQHHVQWGAAPRIVPRLLEEHHAHPQSSGFYVLPGKESLVAMAMEDTDGVTDKVTKHNYQTIYAKLFELGVGKHRVHKMLEIGLGCNTNGGPAISAGARLWRRYFPHAQMWFAEPDQQCLVQQATAIKELNVNVVAGDQKDPATLARWVRETGGDFDVIIDDGGHQNDQMWQSLQHLFSGALKPGGIYIIEDMGRSRMNECKPDDKLCAVLPEVLTQWIDQLIMRDCTTYWKEKPQLKGSPHYPLIPGIKSIECSAEACTITKCFLEDPACIYKSCTDPQEQAKSPWRPQ